MYIGGGGGARGGGGGYIGQLYYNPAFKSANSQEMFSTCGVCDIIVL